jgi:GT2 family glycosyltransferase
MDSGRRLDPRLTVLMPVYNGERYLDEAIASVVEQDFKNLEFVIVDDASTDSTPRILRDWAARDNRIVILRSRARNGIARSLNYGLANARGEYVARQDADDVWLSGRLARQIDLLDADKGVILVSANYYVIDSDGERIGTMLLDNPPAVIDHLLHFGNVVGGHGQVMFRRDVVMQCGGYSEELELSEDYDLWARLRRSGRIVILPIIGMKHRMHEARWSVLNSERQRRNSMATSGWMLEQLLGRSLTPDEANAVQSVWAAEGNGDVATDAERIFRAAYEHCAAASPTDRRRIRFVTAIHWFDSAVMLIRCASMVEAVRHLRYAARWHPGAIKMGLILAAGRAWNKTQRAIRQATRGVAAGSRGA